MTGAAAHAAVGPVAAGRAREVRVWDPLVRLSNWTIAAAVVLNGLIIDEDAAVHLWIGCVALGLLVPRLVWGVIGAGPARFSSFPPGFGAAKVHALKGLKNEQIAAARGSAVGAVRAQTTRVYAKAGVTSRSPRMAS